MCDKANHSPTLESSLICLDQCNLESEVRRLEALGMTTLHIDILDGAFSPSMPLGLGTVRQLRKKTDMNFDVHLMTLNDDFFIDEMIDIGVQSMCFHAEGVRHTDEQLSRIKRSGIKGGIALKPSTSLHELDFILPDCDFILLMLINPGYAGYRGVTQVPYADRKIRAMRKMVERESPGTKIMIDGRVSWDNVFAYADGFVDSFVLGSTCMEVDFEENLAKFAAWP